MRFLAYFLLFGLVAGFVDEAPITIYLAGDSTMAPKEPDKRPETGWGERFQFFFNETEVRVENHARNGRSTRSFIEEGRWQAIVDALRPGDYVFIQFGHNDQKENTDRYASPEQYGANLVRFAREVRAKQATPVLLTPVVRRRFDDAGQFYDTHGEYPEVVRRTAAELDAPMIDMHSKSETVLRSYGVEASKELFLQLAPGDHPNYPQGVEDNTHFSPRGAEIMAGLAVKGIRELRLDLVHYMKASGESREE